jgi:hypothetical protein
MDLPITDVIHDLPQIKNMLAKKLECRKLIVIQGRDERIPDDEFRDEKDT